jgi:hypothetical protein
VSKLSRAICLVSANKSMSRSHVTRWNWRKVRGAHAPYTSDSIALRSFRSSEDDGKARNVNNTATGGAFYGTRDCDVSDEGGEVGGWRWKFIIFMPRQQLADVKIFFLSPHFISTAAAAASCCFSLAPTYLDDDDDDEEGRKKGG